ncbi:hypothetical protein NP233_g8733 [Leucocoprinus birnbaumii]|uniref:RING-type E3 ubiquitin transferase n=1 Tax=Leucocoprinus birnbaumii TaxID=56174 RepID=A0AAD5VLT8_9AGAR|nr:hypothetical protein NP233_g8733 [Leucocoprinus birnbaumii]
MAGPPSFPRAQQAQIIRANQRDIYHVSSLRDQTDNVLRSWLGTRWLTRWEKEVDLLTKLLYFGITSGRGNQSLGEEYTDIWQYSSFTSRTPPSIRIRGLLIFLSTFPSYFLAKWAASPGLSTRHPRFASFMKTLPSLINVSTEVNLAIFYLRGSYYDLSRRLLGVQHVRHIFSQVPFNKLINFKLSSIPENPHIRPPSYSLLGVLIGIRLLHRFVSYIQSRREEISLSTEKGKQRDHHEGSTTELFLDEQSVLDLLDLDLADEPAKPAEEDERTILDVASIPDAVRAGRNCTLCLEERTDSCSTECGHLFCWNCIVGWGREKASLPAIAPLSLMKFLLGGVSAMSPVAEPRSTLTNIQFIESVRFT